MKRGIQPLPPGYFGCGRALKIIKKLQDLIRHQSRYSYDLEFAQPLEKLLPKGFSPANQSEIITQEINKLLHVATVYLKQIDCRTEVIFPIEQPSTSFSAPLVFKDRTYEIIGDYFQLPSEFPQRNYESVMCILNEGIGTYEFLRQRAFRQWFNPLNWLALIVRFPITIFERAGLTGDEGFSRIVTRVYSSIAMGAIAILLSLICLKLGLTIPWTLILPHH
jgi:hypothetical protein